jgi:hypothetical protein
MIPAIILILIAFPSFKLLYLMDEVNDSSMSVLAEGHQWYWSYQYPDFLNSDDEFIELDLYLVPESDLNPKSDSDSYSKYFRDLFESIFLNLFKSLLTDGKDSIYIQKAFQPVQFTTKFQKLVLSNMGHYEKYTYQFNIISIDIDLDEKLLMNKLPDVENLSTNKLENLLFAYDINSIFFEEFSFELNYDIYVNSDINTDSSNISSNSSISTIYTDLWSSNSSQSSTHFFRVLEQRYHILENRDLDIEGSLDQLIGGLGTDQDLIDTITFIFNQAENLTELNSQRLWIENDLRRVTELILEQSRDYQMDTFRIIDNTDIGSYSRAELVNRFGQLMLEIIREEREVFDRRLSVLNALYDVFCDRLTSSESDQ